MGGIFSREIQKLEIKEKKRCYLQRGPLAVFNSKGRHMLGIMFGPIMDKFIIGLGLFRLSHEVFWVVGHGSSKVLMRRICAPDGAGRGKVNTFTA
jgi:hypothetical protein